MLFTKTKQKAEQQGLYTCFLRALIVVLYTYIFIFWQQTTRSLFRSANCLLVCFKIVVEVFILLTIYYQIVLCCSVLSMVLYFKAPVKNVEHKIWAPATSRKLNRRPGSFWNLYGLFCTRSYQMIVFQSWTKGWEESAVFQKVCMNQLNIDQQMIIATIRFI